MHLFQQIYTYTRAWLSDYQFTAPMKHKAAIAFLAAFQVSSAAIGGRQVPVVDGVVGGIPANSGSTQSTAQSLSLTSFATTPGKLRFKENSGVCGT